MNYLRGTYPMVSSIALSLSSLFWGMHNNGEPQRIAIDHYTSGYVVGVRGEDIHKPAPSDTASTIIVAILDTGVDESHPALKKFIVPGYNFVNNNSDTNDVHGHGTHLAGIVALQAVSSDNTVQIMPIKVVQVGPNAPIRPQAVEPGAGTALTENVAKGIIYAIEHGAKVINLSLAWPMGIRSKKVDEAMELASKNNIIVVGSAANDSTQANLYPCVYNNVICVGAHGPDGAVTHFSNYGSMVDVLAPGITILSTWPMNKSPVTFAGQVGYEFRNGTSMAAPFVAGAAAELLSRGFTPAETKAKILLGSRTRQNESHYTTQLTGKYTPDQKLENKFFRFGNLDISRAINTSPQPLILPENKAPVEVIWNGIDTQLTVNFSIKNFWRPAKNIKIIMSGQTQNIPYLDQGSVTDAAYTLSLSRNAESIITQPVQIEYEDEFDQKIKNKFPVTFSVRTKISGDFYPEKSTVHRFLEINPRAFTTVRSVISSDQSSAREILFIKKDELVLTRNGSVLGKNKFDAFQEDKLFNFYRIENNNYALVASRQIKGEPRPSFLIRYMNEKMEVLSDYSLGTEFTILPENFIWKKTGQTYNPFWISVGVTPTIDKPAYDPWNPNPIDSKMPRIYYIKDKALHTIKLDADELPLQVFSNGEVLIAKGQGYWVQYQTLSLDLSLNNQKIVARNNLDLNQYRMLIGLESRTHALNLSSASSDAVLFSGPSSPGNLRSTIVSSRGVVVADQILLRESALDSLISILGAFIDNDKQSFFVQTHYDLKFYREDHDHTQSLSLNRYSYIPSMIFSRNFFPFIIKNDNDLRLPALYIPASLANTNISEVIVGNPKTGTISKPARLRFETSNECLPLANLIPATQTEAAQQVFICNQKLILVPITIGP